MAIGRFEQRIERLEGRIGVKPGPRLIYVTNLEPDEPEESPFLIKLSSELWANVFGAPLTDKEEIRALKERFGED